MLDNRNTLNLKVGEKIEYLYHNKWYNGKVVEIKKSNYEVGTIGYANGDTYIEPIIEIEFSNGATMITSVPHAKLIRRLTNV